MFRRGPRTRAVRRDRRHHGEGTVRKSGGKIQESDEQGWLWASLSSCNLTLTQSSLFTSSKGSL